MVSQSELLTFNAGLLVPGNSPKVHFDVISECVEGRLKEFEATGEIIDSAIELLAEPWYVEDEDDAVANRLVIVQSVAAGPDSQTVRQAISSVTGADIDPLHVALADIFQDIAKPPKLSRQSQAGGLWLMSQRLGIADHPENAKKKILQSKLPDEHKGKPLKVPVAIAVGEHHANQPPPSIEYGCGTELDFLTGPIRDSVSPSDWFGAKFFRDNAGNRDENGEPLSDLVRSQQYWDYLNYFFRRYWYVNERNNAGQVARAVYEGMGANHPSRVAELETVASLGSASLYLAA